MENNHHKGQPPIFPTLSVPTAECNQRSKDPQCHVFNLRPTLVSSDNDLDIAREALRLTRETLHGSIGMSPDTALVSISSTHTSVHFAGSVLSNDSQARRDSSCSDGDRPSSPASGNSQGQRTGGGGGMRLNKFVRRLHDMLINETKAGRVEWRRGLLILKDTHGFAKDILPKYFNTRNFKTFRRQLNYYGFVHIRSFSNNGESTTALWVNGELAGSPSTDGTDPDDVSSVLLLRRMEPCDQAKTAEMRRARKELAINTIEKDFGVSAKTLQLQQLGDLSNRCSKSKRAIQKMQKEQQKTQVKDNEGEPQPMVVEHCTQTTEEPASAAAPLPTLSLPVETVNYNAVSAAGKVPSVPASSPAVVVHPAPHDTNTETPAQLASNQSAANLLLLLSKA